MAVVDALNAIPLLHVTQHTDQPSGQTENCLAFMEFGGVSNLGVQTEISHPLSTTEGEGSASAKNG
jgi:3,4-dihydroxy-2-butanone 4-phosphate synthase